MSFTIRTQWPSLSHISCAIIILASFFSLNCVAWPAVLRNSNNNADEKAAEGNGKPKGPNPVLFPNNHIDAVKIERDGALNKEFKQELFWGPEHEEMTSVQEEEGRGKLMEIFKK